MGIPKFYRWLSERYPLLNQKVTSTEGPPEIDNLYLDMNGIIHNCTHANRSEVKNDEHAMMLKTFDYLDKLVHVIKPRKVLFMAIDGCAPRAKMNQQRARRFKSAEERKKLEEEKRKKGEEVSDDPFDSNCITPGTAFMARLGAHLRFFIRKKMAEDPVWQAPTVVFSGHEVPGEGEHKIMEYIRLAKKAPVPYAPNQRHCLYGLDADLIMLSLVTHEPHFCLLREVVSYTGGNRGQPAREVLENPCAENFILFQIGLLREYLELEFQAVKLPFPLDVERIIDDFVLFCMLIGNDFLPALPTLDINEGALNTLIDLYKELLPQFGGYLTHAGQLDRGRLEVLAGRLAQLELRTLEERAADAEFMENKRARGGGRGGGGGGGGRGGGRGGGGGGYGNGTPSLSASNGAANSHNRAATSPARNGNSGATSMSDPAYYGADDAPLLGRLGLPGGDPMSPLLGPLEELEGDEPAAEEAVAAAPTMMSREARQLFNSGQGGQALQMWKERYYFEKLKISRRGAEAAAGVRAVTEAYLAGLHWVLEYYYRGVASWNWYYPYHYAPMASEMTKLNDVKVKFVQGTPFRPFEQLLGVLPSASKRLLPEPFQWLMTDPSSSILDFYPLTFELDMEGKRADWEAVVMVPFVDEERLLNAVRSVSPSKLSAEERQRNEPGEILVFSHTAGDSGETEFCTSTMPQNFQDVVHVTSKCNKLPPPPALPAGQLGFIPAFCPGTTTGLGNPPGFPTLKTMQIKTQMRNAGCNILGTPSRRESLIVTVKDLREAMGAETLSSAQIVQMANTVLGARAYVNWPYLQESVVARLSTASQMLYQGAGGTQVKQWSAQEGSKWATEASILSNALLVKMGVDIGKVDLVVHVRSCLGFVRHLDGSVEKQYSKDEVAFPLQAVVRTRPGVSEQSADALPSSATTPLTVGQRVLFLGKQHFGCFATILPDLGAGLGRGGQKLVNPAAGRTSFRVAVIPAGEAGDAALRTAKRVVKMAEVRYQSSGQIAKDLGVSPRTLGRLTGNCWLQEGDERDRFDVGLLVRSNGGGKGGSGVPTCVPGYSRPMGNEENMGWTYSSALKEILKDYKERHAWLWQALEQRGDLGGGDIKLHLLLPDHTPDERKAKATAIQKWLKSLPLAKRSLVKTSVEILTEAGVRTMQSSLAINNTRAPPVVEFENVPPALLVPPYTPTSNASDRVRLAIVGGTFELGDRVVSILDSAVPPFGLRGTVIGIYDEACEVLWDAEFAGGQDLNGRVAGKCGLHLPKDHLLNVSNTATVPLNKASAPREVAGPVAWQQQSPRSGALAPPAMASGQQQRSGGQAPSAAARAAASAAVAPGKAAASPASAAGNAPVAASPPCVITRILAAASAKAGPAATAATTPPSVSSSIPSAASAKAAASAAASPPGVTASVPAAASAKGGPAAAPDALLAPPLPSSGLLANAMRAKAAAAAAAGAAGPPGMQPSPARPAGPTAQAGSLQPATAAQIGVVQGNALLKKLLSSSSRQATKQAPAAEASGGLQTASSEPDYTTLRARQAVAAAVGPAVPPGMALQGATSEVTPAGSQPVSAAGSLLLQKLRSAHTKQQQAGPQVGVPAGPQQPHAGQHLGLPAGPQQPHAGQHSGMPAGPQQPHVGQQLGLPAGPQQPHFPPAHQQYPAPSMMLPMHQAYGGHPVHFAQPPPPPPFMQQPLQPYFMPPQGFAGAPYPGGHPGQLAQPPPPPPPQQYGAPSHQQQYGGMPGPGMAAPHNHPQVNMQQLYTSTYHVQQPQQQQQQYAPAYQIQQLQPPFKPVAAANGLTWQQQQLQPKAGAMQAAGDATAGALQGAKGGRGRGQGAPDTLGAKGPADASGPAEGAQPSARPVAAAPGGRGSGPKKSAAGQTASTTSVGSTPVPPASTHGAALPAGDGGSLLHASSSAPRNRRKKDKSAADPSAPSAAAAASGAVADDTVSNSGAAATAATAVTSGSAVADGTPAATLVLPELTAVAAAAAAAVAAATAAANLSLKSRGWFPPSTSAASDAVATSTNADTPPAAHAETSAPPAVDSNRDASEAASASSGFPSLASLSAAACVPTPTADTPHAEQPSGSDLSSTGTELKSSAEATSDAGSVNGVRDATARASEAPAGKDAVAIGFPLTQVAEATGASVDDVVAAIGAPSLVAVAIDAPSSAPTAAPASQGDDVSMGLPAEDVVALMGVEAADAAAVGVPVQQAAPAPRDAVSSGTAGATASSHATEAVAAIPASPFVTAAESAAAAAASSSSGALQDAAAVSPGSPVAAAVGPAAAAMFTGSGVHSAELFGLSGGTAAALGVTTGDVATALVVPASDPSVAVGVPAHVRGDAALGEDVPAVGVPAEEVASTVARADEFTAAGVPVAAAQVTVGDAAPHGADQDVDAGATSAAATTTVAASRPVSSLPAGGAEAGASSSSSTAVAAIAADAAAVPVDVAEERQAPRDDGVEAAVVGVVAPAAAAAVADGQEDAVQEPGTPPSVDEVTPQALVLDAAELSSSIADLSAVPERVRDSRASSFDSSAGSRTHVARVPLDGAGFALGRGRALPLQAADSAAPGSSVAGATGEVPDEYAGVFVEDGL